MNTITFLRKTGTLLALLFLLTTNWAMGQAFTGTYSFGSGGNVTSFNFNGTAISNLTVDPITKNGVSSSSSTNNFRASGWTTGSTNGGAAGGTRDASDYFEFTITAATGYTISNPTLSFGVGRSATGPRRFEWRSSIDTFNSAISVGTFNASISHSSGVLTTPDANSGYTGNEISITTSGQTSITFRFYAYGAEQGGGTGGLQGNLTFGGTLAVSSTTATLAGYSSQLSGNIAQGGSNVPLTGFTINNSASGDFTGITFDLSGSATSSDVSDFRIFRDFNGDGIINTTGGTDASVSGTGVTHSGSIAFSISGETGFTGSRSYLLVCDVDAAATITDDIIGSASTFTSSLSTATGSVTGNSREIAGAAPALIAAGSATVDNAFNVTFADNSAWRAAITSITVDGVTLTAGYSVTAGQITFTPSASAPASLLQSSGSKSIVVIATGYSNGTVSQAIGHGAATKLGIQTQPTAPASNGGALATQPVVLVQDQYNNTVTSSIASVTASVGAGTWTLGGTTSVNASSGIVTFSGLTATSAAAVTGADIDFTSSGLTDVTSNAFNIPGPAFQSITSFGVDYTENFDSYRGTSVTLSAPTTVSGGQSQSGVYDNSGTWSFSNGVFALYPGSGTDYAIGAKVAANSGNCSGSGQTIIEYTYRNNTGGNIGTLDIDWNVEQYATAGRPSTINFDYKIGAGSYVSSNISGTTLTTASTGSDANITVATTNRSITISNLAIADGVEFTLRFTICTGSGSGNNVHIGIDDLVVNATQGTASYYYQSPGDMTALASWNTDPGGTGSAPGNFTANDQTFIFRNDANTSVNSGTWTVSGTNSTIQVGDNSTASRTLTIDASRAIDGTISLSQPGSGNGNALVISNTAAPTLGTLHSTADVTYNAAGAQSIQAANYDNLTLGGSGTKTLAGNVGVTGTLSVPSGVTLDADAYVVSGTGDVDVQSGATLITSHAGGLNGFNTTSGGLTDYSTGANYTFDGSSSQVFGAAMPTTVNNLTLANSNTAMNLPGNLTVSGALTLTGTNLGINGNSLTVNGGFTRTNGTEMLIGSSASNLTIGASSGLSDLYMSQASAGSSNRLNNLTINRNVNLLNALGIQGVVSSVGVTLTTGSNLTLAAPSNSVYGQIAPDAAISGSVTVEKTFANTNAGWRHMMFPVSSPSVSGLDLLFSNHTPANQQNVYYWDAGTTGTAPGWTAAANISTMRGYAIYSNNAAANNIHDISTTISVTGTPILSNQTFSTPNTTDPSNGSNVGWNLIGNPYPHNISIADLLNTGNNSNFQSGNKSLSIYDGVNFSGSNATTSDYIAPFQAVWVRASGASQSVTMAGTGVKTTTTGNRQMKKNFDIFGLNVADDENRYDNIYVHFESTASDNYEGTWDIPKLRSTRDDVPTMYGYAGAEKVYQNAVAPKQQYSMPLFFESKFDGKAYSFKALTDRYEANLPVTLEDKKTGTMHNILTADYSFNHDVKFDAQRFVLHFGDVTNNVAAVDATTKVKAYISNGMLVLSSEDYIANTTVQVVDVLGRTWFEGALSQGTQQISLPENAKGILFIHISNGKEKTTIKTIK